MNRLDPPRELNHEAILNTIYELQVSLKMLTEQLARERQPQWSDRLLFNLSCLHSVMHEHHPSLKRH